MVGSEDGLWSGRRRTLERAAAFLLLLRRLLTVRPLQLVLGREAAAAGGHHARALAQPRRQPPDVGRRPDQGRHHPRLLGQEARLAPRPAPRPQHVGGETDGQVVGVHAADRRRCRHHVQGVGGEAEGSEVGRWEEETGEEHRRAPLPRRGQRLASDERVVQAVGEQRVGQLAQELLEQAGDVKGVGIGVEARALLYPQL